MYRVLEPKLVKTTEPFYNERGVRDGYIHKFVEWIELGIAEDLADAYRKFPRGRKYGYAHILEEIKVH